MLRGQRLFRIAEPRWRPGQLAGHHVWVSDEAGSASTQFRLLGPLEVVRGAQRVDLGGPKQRAVLALLLLEAGRVVSVDRLVDVVWGDASPRSAAASLQAYISNLRRLLRDDERATSPIARRGNGYEIDVAPEDVDVTGFVAECAQAQAAVDGHDWATATSAAQRAAARWRGPLLVEFADEPWVQVVAAPLEEQRATCAQNLVVGLLGRGQIDAAVAGSRQLVNDQPLSERACWVQMVALHRAGRSADALDALRRHTTLMRDELGLEIGPSLRDLQGAILRQDPGLSSWPDSPRANSSSRTRSAAAPSSPASSPPWTPTPAVVEPHTPTSPVAEKPASDLVGRTREMSVIDGVLGEAVTAGLRWVVLTGAAGIGKSRLAEEAVTAWSQRHGRVVRSGCPEDEGVPEWWPIRQLVRDLGADPDTVLTPPSGVHADVARFAVYDAVASVLARSLRDGPLLLLVEDVHWADRASLRFLTHLAATSNSTLVGLAVVMTVRTGEGGDDVGRLLSEVARRAGSRQLALPPLTSDEVGRLAGQVSGHRMDALAAEHLAARTAGNPFFVCEYARLPADERSGSDVPAAIRSVLGRRLAVLDAGVLQVLRTAAVIGDTLDIDLLADVTRLDREELADLLDEATDEHVIVPARGGGAYTFAHALMRDEVIAGLSAMRRQRLHLRVADAIGPGGGGDRLVRRAAHLVAAGPLAETGDVFDACRAAALDAEQRWHPDSAAQWWGHAIAAFDQLSEPTGHDRDDLVVAQVTALARAGRGQTVLDVIDAALLDAVRRDRLDSAGRLASALLRTSGSWPWAVYGSDPAPLVARLAAVEALTERNPVAHVSVLAALAVGSCYDPDANVPDRLSRRALDIAEDLDDPDALADALLGRALAFSGIAVHAVESARLVERLATIEHRLSAIDDVIGHGLLFLARMALGDAAAAAEHARLGALGSDVLRLANSRVQFRWAEGTLRLLRGDDLAGAEAVFDRALELHKQTELYESGVFDVAMLTLRWEQGRLTTKEFATTKPRVVPWAAAVCAAAESDPRADELIAAELSRVEPPLWTTHGRLTMLAHAAADAGLRHHAGPLLERLAPIRHCLANIGQVGVVGPVSLATARLAVLLDDYEAARAHLDVAVELAERAQSHVALLRCRLLAAQLDGADGTVLAAIADEARRRGMRGVEREARALAVTQQQAAS